MLMGRQTASSGPDHMDAPGAVYVPLLYITEKSPEGCGKSYCITFTTHFVLLHLFPCHTNIRNFPKDADTYADFVKKKKKNRYQYFRFLKKI